MILTLQPGQLVELGIAYLDETERPMQAPALLDYTPRWTHENPAIATLTVAPDGLTAQVEAQGAGSDLVQVALSVGGRLPERPPPQHSRGPAAADPHPDRNQTSHEL